MDSRNYIAIESLWGINELTVVAMYPICSLVDVLVSYYFTTWVQVFHADILTFNLSIMSIIGSPDNL